MGALEELLTSFHVGEWLFGEESEHCKIASKVTGMRVVEYGLAHEAPNAPWVVWATFILDGEEVTAEAKSVKFPTPTFVSGIFDKIAVAGMTLGGITPEGKDELLKILGKL